LQLGLGQVASEAAGVIFAPPERILLQILIHDDAET
jgi:hypothetical protein